MAALHDELLTAVKHLRAFLIRKMWSTASPEKNALAVDTFDVNVLSMLLQQDVEHIELWKYFAAFYHKKDQRYFNHDEQKNISSLILGLKTIEDGKTFSTQGLIKIFQELNVEPLSDFDLQTFKTKITAESSVEAADNANLKRDDQQSTSHTAPIITQTDISTLTLDPLQKLILTINESGKIPNNVSEILSPYESSLANHYANAPRYLPTEEINHQLTSIIKIFDFFVISEKTNCYNFLSQDFETDLSQRYILLTHYNYATAVTKLLKNPKDDVRYLKDVLDITNAASSALIFTPSEALQSLFPTFQKEQTKEDALKILNDIQSELNQLNLFTRHDNGASNESTVDNITANIHTDSNKKHPYYLDGRLEPVFKESPNYDEELTQELKASFNEEATEEIFPLIDNAIKNLQSPPYKESDILDLRRAFHTLKGSGYTASLPIIGELGWQVERVINGVRDNHYPFNEAIFYHALDGNDAIRLRVNDPTYEDDELYRLTYQAQHLIDHKGNIEFDHQETKDQQHSATQDITFESFDDAPETFVSPYHLQGSAPISLTDTTSLDEALVAELKISMLDEVKSELLPELNNISPNLLKNTITHKELDTLRRVFHTLKGNALMVGLNALGELSSTIETIIDAALSGKHKITPAIIFHILDVYRLIKKFLNDGTLSDTEVARLLHQGNMLRDHDGEINNLLSQPVKISAPLAQPSSEDALQERRQALVENLQTGIEQKELHQLDHHLSHATLNISDEELTQKLISSFTKCETRTYSALKRYSQDVGLCLLHENFSSKHGLHNLLINAYHKHLLLFRAYGLTPHDDRLILWGKVLTAVLAIIKTNSIDETVVYEYLEALQKPIIDIDQGSATIDKAKTQSEEIDQELMQAFIEEAHEVLEQSEELIQAWKATNYNPHSELIAELRRQMHTLKGGARMVGKDGLGQLSHTLESLLDPNYITLFDSDPTRFDVLQRALDHLQVLLDSPNKRLDPEGFNLLSALYLLLGHENPPELTLEGTVTGESTATELSDKTATAAQSELSSLKISPMQLNLISEKVSENNILTTQYNNSISSIIGILSELTRTTQHLNTTARNIEIETEAQMVSRHARASKNKEEFDPLELDQFSELQHLARSVAESIEDLNTFHKHVTEYVEQINASLAKFSGNQTIITDTLTDISTVSFNNILPRLRRLVRQVSKSNQKQVEFVAIGSDTQVERIVLEQMTAAFEHMIRNSIIHGIESPEERAASGKPAHGTITFKVSKVGSDLSIEITDDGRGFDVQQIRHKAIEQGLIDHDTIIDDTELVNLIMLPGFSTAQQLSQDAGRGVGLDVLTKALTILKGTADLSFIHNAGVTFSISIPATLMIVQSLIVDAGGQNYAIPIDHIIGVTQEKNVVFNDDHTQLTYHNDVYSVYDLSLIYSETHRSPMIEQQNYTYLLFEVDGQLIAVGAESIISQIEVIMHPLNPQISNIPGLTGSAVTPDGSTIFTVDISTLSQSQIHLIEKKELSEQNPVQHTEEVEDSSTIFVIDDSITMRKVSQRMLERAGYNVVTAKDGLDAIEILKSLNPDLIMLDIEMPRMDGFEVLTYLRSHDQFMKTPVMMVTSRSGEKHRNRAFEIGANEYCGKPYQEEQILHMISKLLNKADNE